MNIKRNPEYLSTMPFTSSNRQTAMDKLSTDCATLQESTNKNSKENSIKSSLNGQNKLANLLSKLKKMISQKDKMIQDFQFRLKNIQGTQL
jgi:hypothetical protein